MRRPLAFLIALFALLALVPQSSGHNAAAAPEQYTRFLSDCSDDWGGHSAVRDGHDLVALDMTERWMDEHDEPGFFVLMTVAFGFAESGSRGGPLRDEVEITGPDGPFKVRLTTDDNTVFTAEKASGFLVPDVIMPVRQSVLSNGQPDGSRILVEFGFRYSVLGFEIGDKITGAKVQAFARQDRGDFMPGGYFLLGVSSSDDPYSCPQSGHQGQGNPGTLYDKGRFGDYTIQGPETLYVDLSLGTDALAASGSQTTSLNVNVRNKFANQAQDITVTSSAPNGWKVTVNKAANAPPLERIAIPVELNAPTGTASNGTLKLFIDTSIGGHGERELPVYWYPAGVSASVPTTAKEEAPGIELTWLCIAVVAGALAFRRRR